MNHITPENRTTQLFKELESSDNPTAQLYNFRKNHKKDAVCASLSDYLNMYLASHPELSISGILRDAGISENYGRQFFNGHKKKPSKYQLTAVCIGAGMNLKETQRALKLAGCAELYPRIDVDAAIIICINNSIHKVADIEEFFLKNDITESPFPTVTKS